MEIRKFKESAKAVAAALQSKSVTVSHADMLESLSQGFGQRNWCVLRAQLEHNESSPGTKAVRLYDEVLDATESFSDFVEQYDPRSMFNLFYLMGAVLKGNVIELEPGKDLQLLSFLEELPSAQEWKKYVVVRQEVNHELVDALVEDVTSRLRRHGGAIAGLRNARDLAEQSALLLREEPNAMELEAAAVRLATGTP